MEKNKYLSRFDKATAASGHSGTVLGAAVLPEGMNAPFDHSWGYLEGKSMMEPHSHPVDEVYLFVSGKGYCHVDNDIFPVVPGDVVEIPSNMTHTVECEDRETVLWAAFWWEHTD